MLFSSEEMSVLRDLLGFRDFLSDFYLRLWRVTCGTRPVWRNRISHSELNAVTVCSTYANGWEVYLEASLTEPATATGFFLGYSAGNADSGALCLGRSESHFEFSEIYSFNLIYLFV